MTLLQQQFDSRVPADLKEVQQWFASIITQPIDQHSRMIAVPTEADRYLIPSPTLRPQERIQIYCQQYWWRLLTALQQTFPLVVRLFGTLVFNEIIGKPYLTKYPANHWSLHLLGLRLPQWIAEDYTEADKQLILDAACIDWAYEEAFLEREEAPLEIRDSSDLSAPLTLQPHIRLFDLGYDLFSYRDSIVKEPQDHWMDHDFPILAKGRDYTFVVFRSHQHEIIWKEISRGQYTILLHLQQGCTIEEACQQLEEKHPSLIDEAMSHIHLWFQEWAIRRWICPRAKPPI